MRSNTLCINDINTLQRGGVLIHRITLLIDKTAADNVYVSCLQLFFAIKETTQRFILVLNENLSCMEGKCTFGDVDIRAVVYTAYRDHKIKENPNGFLDRIDTIPTEKEHLSQQYLQNNNYISATIEKPAKNKLANKKYHV